MQQHCLICLYQSGDNGAEGLWYITLLPPGSCYEGSQDCHLLNCAEPRCSDQLPSAPLPFSSLAHDKRVIDSETDALGCFLAAYQQQSLSSSFRSLSGLMKDRRWNAMAVIATVAPSLAVTTQLSLFPTNSGIKAVLIPKYRSRVVLFLRSLFLLNGIFVPHVSASICKYLWVCFTLAGTLQLILF